MRQKGFAPILIILLVVLGFAVYHFYPDPRLGQNTVSPTETPITDASPFPKIFPEPTPSITNWKVYSNAEYGFIVEYPSDMEISAPTDHSNKGIISINAPLSQPVVFLFGDFRLKELGYIQSWEKEYGKIRPSEFPTINFLGKTYSIGRTNYGEGFPNEQFPNCTYEMNAYKYYFDVDNRMLVYFPTTEEKGCDKNGKATYTNNFNENISLAKKILSTFKFTQ